MLEYIDGKTKAQSIVESISAKILHGVYNLGERLPSERELAEAYCVSRDTVRQAYNILEQTGLLKRVRGSGTHISTELRGHSEPIQTIALLCPDVYDKFGMKFLVALEKAIAQRNVLMVLKITNNLDTDDTILLDMMQRGINNFIIWPTGNSDLSAVCYRLRALGANLVFFDRIVPEGYADFVGLDNKDAMVRILEHARVHNAETYTFLSLSDIVGDSTFERKQAFIEWCELHNFDYDIFYTDTLQEDKTCIINMLDKHMVDERKRAYVCVNDYTALQLVNICLPFGLLYSIDGLIAGNSHGIITMSQPLDEMAHIAVELLFEQQQQGDKWRARKVILKGELIE